MPFSVAAYGSCPLPSLNNSSLWNYWPVPVAASSLDRHAELMNTAVETDESKTRPCPDGLPLTPDTDFFYHCIRLESTFSANNIHENTISCDSVYQLPPVRQGQEPWCCGLFLCVCM
jgi:hypothetical protein